MPFIALTSTQVLQKLGISNADLQAYEREGLVAPLRVDEARYYSPRDFLLIEIAIMGRRLQFSLREVRRLIAAHMPAHRSPILAPTQLDEQIIRLESERADLEAALHRLRVQRDAL